MKILVNVTESKKDLIKGGNTVTMFKDVKGEKLNMTGIIIFEKEENNAETGEVKTKVVSCIKTDKGFISSISPTVRNSLELIANSYEKDEILKGIPVEIKSKKSNGGREFLYIDLI